MLVLTRAWSDGTLSDVTAAFLNWRVFECPELNLQDIRIPLRTFPGGTLPSGGDIADMVRDFQSRNEHLRERVDGNEWERIETELAQFEVESWRGHWVHRCAVASVLRGESLVPAGAPA